MADDDDDESIADIVFQRSRQQQLVAEGLFGPALAYLVSQTGPTGIQGAVLSWAMAFLVVIPPIRYLVYTDRVAPFDAFLDWTVRPVELCAILGVIQLFTYVASHVSQPFVSLSFIEATAVVTVIAAILFVLAFEILFQKYRLCWGTLFYVKLVAIDEEIEIPLDDVDAVLGSIMDSRSSITQLRAALAFLAISLIKIVYGQTAFYLLKDSVPDRDGDEHMATLQEFVEMNRSKNRFHPQAGLYFAMGLAGLVVFPLLSGVAWVLSWLLASFGTMVLTLVVMRLTKHIVALSYIAFGTMDFEQFVVNNQRWVVLMFSYTAIVYLMFFHTTV